MAYKIVNDDSLTSVADAIRVKGSISGTLEFPSGFVSAIQNLPSGGSNDFIITASKDGQDNFTIDKTFAEIKSAYQDGKRLVVCSTDYIVGYYEYVDTGTPSDDCFYIGVFSRTAHDLVELCYSYYSSRVIPEVYNTYYLPYGNATSSDVASGKTFINRSGRQTGTATPPSGVDMPVFSATWTPDGTPSGAITCNKTYNQCFSLVQSDYMYAAVIMNSFTYPNDPSTYPLYGSYEYIDGQACILYRNYDAWDRSIKYASDGTISVFDATDY